MRVLYVDLEREWRGGQSQALLTVKGLSALGHDAQLLSVRGSPLARRVQQGKHGPFQAAHLTGEGDE